MNEHSAPEEGGTEYTALVGPFAQGGWAAENIRSREGSLQGDDLTQLRESMQAVGWLESHPAVQDEHGVILSGHRRLKVAAELGIEPKVVTLHIAPGQNADDVKLAEAIASNRGFRPLDFKDRAEIAANLYNRDGWTTTQIGLLLHVSADTISRDIAKAEASGVSARAETPPRPKGGRPRTATSPAKKAQATHGQSEAVAAITPALERIGRRYREEHPEETTPSSPAAAPEEPVQPYTAAEQRKVRQTLAKITAYLREIKVERLSPGSEYIKEESDNVKAIRNFTLAYLASFTTEEV